MCHLLVYSATLFGAEYSHLYPLRHPYRIIYVYYVAFMPFLVDGNKSWNDNGTLVRCEEAVLRGIMRGRPRKSHFKVSPHEKLCLYTQQGKLGTSSRIRDLVFGRENFNPFVCIIFTYVHHHDPCRCCGQSYGPLYPQADEVRTH